jgi:hypothetical protein
MKKIILCILTVLTVISLLALPIAANEVSDRPAEQRGEAEQALQNEEAENAEGPAFTTALVGFLEENGSELLGVLTLLGSLLVALLYKTGLLPLLRRFRLMGLCALMLEVQLADLPIVCFSMELKK